MSEKESGKPATALWREISSRSGWWSRSVWIAMLLVCTVSPVMAGADLARMRADLEWIAAPDRAGRAPGSAGSEAVRDYIAAAFGEAGLSAVQEGWFQEVDAKPDADSPEVHLPEGVTWENAKLANVVGIVPSVQESGTTSELDARTTARIVIVGAHFDHLGQSGKIDDEDEDYPSIYPGADDNASGVAILLEAARLLAKSGPFRNRILFLAFDGEESGNLGSSHYVGHPIAPLEQTLAMINLDTIGRMQDRRLYALASGTASELAGILRGVNLGFGFDLSTPEAGSFASDHLSFIEHGIPSVHLSTGANPDYHRPTDTAEKIAWNELAETADFVVELVSFLANESEPLTFVPPGAEKLSAAPQGPPRQVSLGTIPDFARESGGVLLTGVMPGSPAESAGLTKGDIVVSLAGAPIDNLADFSAALKAHQPGDQVTVEVLRDGQKIAYTVALVERARR